MSGRVAFEGGLHGRGCLLFMVNRGTLLQETHFVGKAVDSTLGAGFAGPIQSLNPEP